MNYFDGHRTICLAVKPDPLPAEQILWVKFPVCFSELTEESATTLNKSKKTKKENMQIPKKTHNNKKPTHFPYNRLLASISARQISPQM